MAVAINLSKCALISLLCLIVMNPLVVVIHGTILSQNCSYIEGPCSSCWFIFGDSLFDNGNNNDLNTTAKVNFPPYGVDYPSGPTGRFSNGKNVGDVVAEMLGYKTFIPPHANALDSECGLNYASGGAGILDDTGENLGQRISFERQVGNHGETVDLLRAKYGNETADKMLAKCLYTSNMGPNDFINNYFLKRANGSAVTPRQFAEVLISEYAKPLTKIYNLGARKFAILNLLPPGFAPQIIRMYGNGTGKPVDYLSETVIPFNQMLPQMIQGLNTNLSGAMFTLIDAASFNKVLNQTIPTSATPCCDTNVTDGLCMLNGKFCPLRLVPVPTTPSFWDGYHIMESLVKVFGALMHQSLSSSICNHSTLII